MVFAIKLTLEFLFVSSSWSYEDCKATADWLLAQTDVRPMIAIVCGSGMGGLADMLKDQVAFNYKDIPNFPQSTGEFSYNKHLRNKLVPHLAFKLSECFFFL